MHTVLTHDSLLPLAGGRTPTFTIASTRILATTLLVGSLVSGVRADCSDDPSYVSPHSGHSFQLPRRASLSPPLPLLRHFPGHPATDGHAYLLASDAVNDPPPFSSVDLLPLTTVHHHRPQPTDENLPAVLVLGVIFSVYDRRLRLAIWRANPAYIQNATPGARRAHWHSSALHGPGRHHMDPMGPQFPPPAYSSIDPSHAGCDVGPSFDSVRIRLYRPFPSLTDAVYALSFL